MPYIETNIVSDGKVLLPKIEVQIRQEIPSPHEKDKFVCGRFELPEGTSLDLETPLAIEDSESKHVKIFLIELGKTSDKNIFRFRTCNVCDINRFELLEKS